jgi:hypothetical protein
MDQNTVTGYVQAHLVSLRQGDLEAAAEDFAPQLRPHLPGIVDSLPLPFVTTENLSIEAGPDQAVVLNRLVGENGAVVIMRSVWQEIDGRPRIIDGAPVEA